MKAVSASGILDLWEQEIDQPLLHKTIKLLDLFFPAKDVDSSALLTIGERDLRLFRVREYLFGPIFNNTSVCPVCSEKMEWKNHLNEFNIPEISENGRTRLFDLKSKEIHVQFRLPNSLDIIQIIEKSEENPKPENLLRSCIVTAKRKDKEVDKHKLPQSLLDEVDLKIEKIEPHADIRLKISCVNCEHKWEAGFDIANYLWSEIHSWAGRILNDVYVLASNFGWPEKDILEMSSARRQFYLDMISE
jgi:hypothetical protein